MATTLELMKANHVDSQGDRFSETALKQAEKGYHENAGLHQFVTMGFSPNAKKVPGLADITYRDGALWVTLEGEAEKIVKEQGLVAAAGGHMKVVEKRDGVKHYDNFDLDRVALVKPEDKVK